MSQKKPARTLLFAASLLFAAACSQSAFAEEAVLAPAPKVTSSESGKQTAIFAGGCFWGIEGVFSHLKGVSSAVSGYHGGSKADAAYSRVSDGNTGHAEAVKVTYDPKVIRYDQLLRVFFSVGADPTTLNYQGPDRGTQYRSALVPLNAEQAKVARAYLAQMGKSGVWKAPIVTKIEAYKAFYPAEQHHQDFMLRNPNQGYIVRWDKPKVAALKKMFPGLYSPTFKTG
ncbi:peptide-methionine (S)-S-oxide reductase MsrA [Altererythrobacter sp. CC-YST694]|uniref:peptide-methionine (S)-S-oxide reductase MsrA n=1 Tax=Altererythrobacter sp. CC-YST694 TaxID=2755038 RepID=UPI001D0326B0|nr:peptide-methionine (S)-S-oxide reductase MsrA [Altererythrobacter sp. CC-YST694]MCB5425468.1 peptide-methionine (S)-S-oxide reductase MsrA [Altererythrobacter sp. CC-YST694]